MAGKERVNQAFSLREPDRVPVWEMAINEESIIKLGRFFTDDLPEMKYVQEMTLEDKVKMLRTLFLVVRELDMYAISSMLLLETEPLGGGLFRDSWGRVRRLSEEGEPVTVSGPISGPGDLEDYKPHHPRESDYLMLMAARDHFGDSISQVFPQPGPFMGSRHLVGGMEKFLRCFIKDQAFVHDMMRTFTDYVMESLDMAGKLGTDIICLDEDFAFNQTTLISPRHYRELVLPYHKEIVEHAHGLGMFIFKHSDGNMWPIMDYLVEAGFEGFHPVQPQCMDIGELKAGYGDRLCLVGNMDRTFLLPFGDEDEVERTLRDTIAAAAPGGGYVISSSNTIHPGCRAESYTTMFEATHLGLSPGTAIATGGADTRCGLLGADCTAVGDIGMIAGTGTPVQRVTGGYTPDGEGRLWSGRHVIPGFIRPGEQLPAHRHGPGVILTHSPPGRRRSPAGAHAGGLGVGARR
ncbi:MAG: uroporphyrinogen decarboxylase family protein [Actinomycetota bacterium]|nr:uroporphyrinogen decarboxylase family protein [Actinomycetota bacterium]